jgi:hypothetical protein
MNKVYKLENKKEKINSYDALFYDSVGQINDDIEDGEIDTCDDDIVIVEYQEVKRYKIVTSKPTLVEIKEKKTNGKK